MARRSFKISHCLVAITLVTGTLATAPMVSVAIAQQTDAQLTQQVAALMAANPNGGDALANAIQDVTLANPTQVAVIMAAAQANVSTDAQQASAQMSSVGAGMRVQPRRRR